MEIGKEIQVIDLGSLKGGAVIMAIISPEISKMMNANKKNDLRWGNVAETDKERLSLHYSKKIPRPEICLRIGYIPNVEDDISEAKRVLYRMTTEKEYLRNVLKGLHVESKYRKALKYTIPMESLRLKSPPSSFFPSSSTEQETISDCYCDDSETSSYCSSISCVGIGRDEYAKNLKFPFVAPVPRANPIPVCSSCMIPIKNPSDGKYCVCGAVILCVKCNDGRHEQSPLHAAMMRMRTDDLFMKEVMMKFQRETQSMPSVSNEQKQQIMQRILAEYKSAGLEPTFTDEDAKVLDLAPTIDPESASQQMGEGSFTMCQIGSPIPDAEGGEEEEEEEAEEYVKNGKYEDDDAEERDEEGDAIPHLIDTRMVGIPAAYSIDTGEIVCEECEVGVNIDEDSIEFDIGAGKGGGGGRSFGSRSFSSVSRSGGGGMRSSGFGSSGGMRSFSSFPRSGGSGGMRSSGFSTTRGGSRNFGSSFPTRGGSGIRSSGFSRGGTGGSFRGMSGVRGGSGSFRGMRGSGSHHMGIRGGGGGHRGFFRGGHGIHTGSGMRYRYGGGHGFHGWGGGYRHRGQGWGWGWGLYGGLGLGFGYWGLGYRYPWSWWPFYASYPYYYSGYYRGSVGPYDNYYPYTTSVYKPNGCENLDLLGGTTPPLQTDPSWNNWWAGVIERASLCGMLEPVSSDWSLVRWLRPAYGVSDFYWIPPHIYPYLIGEWGPSHGGQQQQQQQQQQQYY